MSFAIEMHFDEQSTAALEALWGRLQEIGGKARRSELGVRPHVSLAVLKEAPEGLEEGVREVAGRTGAFDLELGAVDFFPGTEGVVFIEAIMSNRLRGLHAEVGEMLKRLGAVNSVLYEMPRWRPHCTVATDVAAELRAEVVAAAEGAEWPKVVRVVAIGGVRYRPATLGFRVALNEMSPRGDR